VIGFLGNNAVVMPFAGLEGVRRGLPCGDSQCASQVRPSSLWLGRVIKRDGRPIDGKGHFAQAVTDALSQTRHRQRNFSARRYARRLDLGSPADAQYLSMTCCRGQRLGILRRSGVGKSVLLSMLSAQMSTADNHGDRPGSASGAARCRSFCRMTWETRPGALGGVWWRPRTSPPLMRGRQPT